MTDVKSRARITTDGRRMRKEQSRDRVADALLALLREGDARPSADAVAKRAGVSRRTVFNQFRDLGALLSQLHVRQLHDVRTAMPAIPRTGTLTERLTKFMEHYVVLLDSVAPVRIAALAFQGSALERQQLRRRLKEIQSVLTGGPLSLLRDAGVVLGADQLAALTALLDPVSYHAMRVQQRLSRARACRVLVNATLALVQQAAARTNISTIARTRGRLRRSA